MKFQYNKLRGRIIEIFGSQERFADYLKTTNQTVSRKMNGNVSFSQKDIVTWSNALDIDLENEVGKYFFA